MNLFTNTEFQPNEPICWKVWLIVLFYFIFCHFSLSLEVVCHADKVEETYAVMSARCSRKYCMEHDEKTNGLLKVALVRRTGAVDMTCWSELLQSLP